MQDECLPTVGVASNYMEEGLSNVQKLALTHACLLLI